MIERQLRWMNELFGLRFCSLRYFNAAGAHPAGQIGEDHTPETHLIPLILQVALGQLDKIRINGDDYSTFDGTCIRDYVHVCDLARAHVVAFERLLDHTVLTYNLGTGHGYSVMEVINVARAVTGHPIPAATGPRRIGDPASLVADSTPTRTELGWRPHFADLETIVETAWRWHRSHPNGYRSRQ